MGVREFSHTHTHKPKYDSDIVNEVNDAMSVPPPAALHLPVNTVVTAVAGIAAAPAAGAAAADAAAAGAAAPEITIGYIFVFNLTTLARYVLYLGNRYLTYFCYPADGSARRRRYSP